MKDLRNPLTRTENFEHPSGNIMKELTEAELNSVAAGAGVARNSGGIACTHICLKENTIRKIQVL